MTTPIVNTDPVESQSRLQHEPTGPETLAAARGYLRRRKQDDLAAMLDVDLAPCAADTYPVWADGSQDHFVCEKFEGHGGKHRDADWTWST